MVCQTSSYFSAYDINHRVGRQGHTSYSSRIQELLKAKSPDVKALSARTLIALCNHVDPSSTTPGMPSKFCCLYHSSAYTDSLSAVTLRESFKPAASDLITFLKDSNLDVQAAGTDALSALSEYCVLKCISLFQLLTVLHS